MFLTPYIYTHHPLTEADLYLQHIFTQHNSQPPPSKALDLFIGIGKKWCAFVFLWTKVGRCGGASRRLGCVLGAVAL
ncbi:hypothetical protein R6Q59_005928 [Mikania micrantha]